MSLCFFVCRYVSFDCFTCVICVTYAVCVMCRCVTYLVCVVFHCVVVLSFASMSFRLCRLCHLFLAGVSLFVSLCVIMCVCKLQRTT